MAPRATKTAPKAGPATAKPTTRLHYLVSQGEPVVDQFECWIVGDTPLIVHAWSHKAKAEMLDKQVKMAKTGRLARDPHEDYLNSLYVLEEGTDEFEPIYGFPATGLKNSILATAHKDKGIAKTDVMSSLFIRHDRMARSRPAKGGAICDLPLVRIYGAQPEMREDMVKIGSGLNKVASLAYRGQFFPWAMRVHGHVNSNVIPSENLAFLIREAGLACGIGEWRNERRGMFGAYHLAKPAEVKAWTDFAENDGPMPVPVADTARILLAAE
jgi:hypothetical protein